MLEQQVHERSLAHKFAEYLQDEFQDWNVDYEYNRKGKTTKVLEGIRECDEQRKTNRIYPDVIVHHRNNKGKKGNLLVIEAKMENSENDPCDRKKLELLTLQTGDFKYCLGLSICFRQNVSAKLIWFIDGCEEMTEIYPISKQAQE